MHPCLKTLGFCVGEHVMLETLSIAEMAEWRRATVGITWYENVHCWVVFFQRLQVYVIVLQPCAEDQPGFFVALRRGIIQTLCRESMDRMS